MTDHISTPLFFLHWAMLCTAISEICPPALKWGGGGSFICIWSMLQVCILKNNLKFSLKTDDVNQYLRALRTSMQEGNMSIKDLPKLHILGLMWFCFVAHEYLIYVGQLASWFITSMSMVAGRPKRFFPQLPHYDYYAFNTKKPIPLNATCFRPVNLHRLSSSKLKPRFNVPLSWEQKQQLRGYVSDKQLLTQQENMEGQESLAGGWLEQTFETNEQTKLIIAHHVRECKAITENVLYDSVLHMTIWSQAQNIWKQWKIIKIKHRSIILKL